MMIPAQRNRREKLPGEEEWPHARRHALRSDTPASANVAISVRIFTAA